MLAACGDDEPPLVNQQNRETNWPHAVVADNHGCLWRLELDQGEWVRGHLQIRPDGTPDCPVRQENPDD